ncbi:MAG: uracil-DNA glycosylase [Desulfobacterales bacterium]|nr:uracil-DNA glycosylase [Desulfobacterales bacterium]
MADSGVTGFECRPETLETIAKWNQPPVPPVLPVLPALSGVEGIGVEGSAAEGSEAEGSEAAKKASGQRAEDSRVEEPVRSSETLEEIRADLGDCTRCRLCENRKNIVFGEGSPQARLLFVGEGPGGDEDVQARPFVGAAGQLLTKIIGAMGLTREEVYIANIIKCRPPNNRNPQPDEIETCFPFLRRQIDAIGPEVICALGKFAAQTLLQTDAPISRLRGRFIDYRGIPVMPTFHPAYLLRNEASKRDTWQDVKKIMGRLGLPLRKTGIRR